MVGAMSMRGKSSLRAYAPKRKQSLRHEEIASSDFVLSRLNPPRNDMNSTFATEGSNGRIINITFE